MIDESKRRVVTSIAHQAVPSLIVEPDALSRHTQRPPVFLHSSFRTGSTWLWHKLRSAQTTIAYYEIFNEVLEKLTPAQAKQINYSAWDSRHPPSTPYFLEFLPLLEPAGGIVGFDEQTAYGNFIPTSGPDGDLGASDKTYVDRLISAAWSQKKIPVLSCTRSLGRARALRRAIGGQTILLHRNLFYQWASYCWQAEAGDRSFLGGIIKTVVAAEHDPFLRGVSDWFGLRHSTPSQDELFEVFIILHLYLYSIAFDAADLVVDLTEIAMDKGVRRRVEREISEMIQHEIDLSDVRENCDFTSLAVDCPQKTRDTIEQFVKLIPTASMSLQGINFVEKVKDRALAEWDHFEFFTRRTRSVLNKKIEDAQRQLDERVAENDGLKTARDRLISERAEADRSHETERFTQDERVQSLNVERDALLDLVSTSETARNDLSRSVDRLTAETHSALEAAANASTAREGLEKELIAVIATRDDLAVSLAQAKIQCDESLYRHARRLLARRKR